MLIASLCRPVHRPRASHATPVLRWTAPLQGNPHPGGFLSAAHQSPHFKVQHVVSTFVALGTQRPSHRCSAGQHRTMTGAQRHPPLPRFASTDGPPLIHISGQHRICSNPCSGQNRRPLLPAPDQPSPNAMPMTTRPVTGSRTKQRSCFRTLLGR